MTIGRLCRAAIAAGALVLATAPLGANVLIPLSPQQRLSQSDLVVIAAQIDCPPGSATDTYCPRPADCHATPGNPCLRTMRVFSTIKGRGDVRTFSYDPVEWLVEDFVPCCRSGRLYLMFLRRARGGSNPFYFSVNGHYAVIELDPDASSSER